MPGPRAVSDGTKQAAWVAINWAVAKRLRELTEKVREYSLIEVHDGRRGDKINV